MGTHIYGNIPWRIILIVITDVYVLESLLQFTSSLSVQHHAFISLHSHAILVLQELIKQNLGRLGLVGDFLSVGDQ